MAEGVVFTRRASGLVRELTWLDIFIFAIAAPAASGINFFSVSTAGDTPGGSIGVAFIIGAIMFIPIMICLAVTTSAMPRSGSVYITVSRVLDPAVGYFGGWMFFFGYGIVIGVLGSIVTGIIGGGFTLAAVAGNMSGLAGIGDFLSGSTGKAIGGIVWTILFWFLTYQGVRSVKWTMRIFFLIPFIATGLAVLFFVTTSPSAAQAAFNSTWGADSFQGIIDAAKDAGWASAGFSLDHTIDLLLVVVWAYVAIEAIAYAGGEIKSPKTSLLRGMFWGAVAVGLFYIIVAFTVFMPFGDFIPAYDYLNDNNPDQLASIMGLETPISPSVPFYASILMGPGLGLLVTIGIALWFANSMIPVFLANSRLAFSLAMDRAFPESLAAVDTERGTPTWATHLTGLFGLLGVAIFTIPGWATILGILNITTLFIFWAYGLAAMLLPYRKPEIYELSAVRFEVAGIPLVTILGFITFVEGMFFVIQSIMPFDNVVMGWMLLVIAIGFLIYLYQVIKTHRAGIDTTQIYSVLPPE